MRIVDQMFIENGILLVALIRLMFLPFGLTSYMLGVTSVSMSDYLIGTLVYFFKTALLCSLGCTIYLATVNASAENGNNNDHPDLNESPHDSTSWGILAAELVLTISITVAVTLWAKYYFDRKFEEAEERDRLR